MATARGATTVMLEVDVATAIDRTTPHWATAAERTSSVERSVITARPVKFTSDPPVEPSTPLSDPSASDQRNHVGVRVQPGSDQSAASSVRSPLRIHQDGGVIARAATAEEGMMAPVSDARWGIGGVNANSTIALATASERRGKRPGGIAGSENRRVHAPVPAAERWELTKSHRLRAPRAPERRGPGTPRTGREGRRAEARSARRARSPRRSVAASPTEF